MRAILLSVLVPMLALAEESAPATTTTPAATASSTATPEVKKDAPKPAANNPLANAVQARTPEEQAAQSGFQVATTLDHYLGMGTFDNPQLYSSLSAWLTINPQYLFSIGKQRLVASVVLRGSYEYTLPDAETGRRWGIFDTRLGLSAPALFKETALTGISFSPSFGLSIPTSLESWNAGLITSVSLGLTASRSVGTVDFRGSVSAGRAFYGQPYNGARNPAIANPNAAAPTDSNGNLIVICRPGELFCAASNNNLAWSGSASASIQWRATGSFLLYVGYTYIYSWKEAATNDPNDPYTAKTLDSNGNPVARAGYGRGDRTSAYFGGSYQLNEHYSIDLGVSTIQLPFFPDNKHVRFPFLSFGSWADNGTSLYFTLSAAY